MSKNPSFCVRPFLQYSSFNGNDFRLCCSAYKPTPAINTESLDIKNFFNDSYITNAREMMSEGKTLRECGACYQLEARGLESDRTLSNKEFLPKYGESIEASFAKNFRIEGPKVLDLRVGNLCNLRCQSCFPNLSQGVFEDFQTIFKKHPHLRSTRQENGILSPGFELSQIIPLLHDVDEIKLIGGEPCLSKQAVELIDYCNKNHFSKNIQLHIHTNLMSDRKEFFKSLVHFREVRFSMSMDGPNQVNDYLRYPSQWNQVIKNFHFFTNEFSKLNHFTLSITPVLQITNLFSIPDLLEYLFDQENIISLGIHLDPIPLTDPNYLSAAILPKSLRKEAQNKYSVFFAKRSPEEQSLLKDFTRYYETLGSGEEDLDLLQQYVEITKKYDHNRSSDVLKVFPSFEKLESLF